MVKAFIIFGFMVGYLLCSSVAAGVILGIGQRCSGCRSEEVKWAGCNVHHCAALAFVFWPLYLFFFSLWRFVIHPTSLVVSTIVNSVAEHQPKRLSGEALQHRIDELERELHVHES